MAKPIVLSGIGGNSGVTINNIDMAMDLALLKKSARTDKFVPHNSVIVFSEINEVKVNRGLHDDTNKKFYLK
jgi:hypothetical protein